MVIHSDPAPCARETVRVVDERNPRKQHRECCGENDENRFHFVDLFVEKDESGEVDDDDGGKH